MYSVIYPDLSIYDTKQKANVFLARPEVQGCPCDKCETRVDCEDISNACNVFTSWEINGAERKRKQPRVDLHKVHGEEREKIKAKRKAGAKLRELAEEYGIGISAIQKICTR